MSRRIFYVVYFLNQRLQKMLDAVRFIANPNEKTPAHITLRGPYTRKGNVDKLSRKIARSVAVVNRVDSFIQEGQNTVFLRCHSEIFREVWSKGDFEFNPHITIYDGQSRDFAVLLLNRIAKMKIQFRFHVSELKPLVTHRGQQSTFLREAFDERFVAEVLECQFNISQVEKMSPYQRVNAIEIFFQKLQNVDYFRLDLWSSETRMNNLVDLGESNLEENQIRLLIG